MAIRLCVLEWRRKEAGVLRTEAMGSVKGRNRWDWSHWKKQNRRPIQGLRWKSLLTASASSGSSITVILSILCRCFPKPLYCLDELRLRETKPSRCSPHT
ncbi:hypothetical protein M413DRAFT_348375 [Hebeloma cylindrosporum]|uniref:Uncharacterized protein n=1 Tax=Hebeloma cylindrosporum TaxID=76867 RepID=A0A0C2Y352_HEBCY|nr:hypothetical protein M413DRAFT_348375 [Hebeloma cylindrosporum h7]